jgi:hypothetical protein
LLRKGKDNPELFKSKEYWLEVFKTLITITEVKEMFGWLKGKKTYFVAGLAAALTLLKALGKIDDATYQMLLALVGAGGAVTVAAKINDLKKNVDNKIVR